MENNIYQTPQSNIDLLEENVEYKIATTGQRLLTLIIDYVCFMIFSFIIGMALALMGNANFIESVNANLLGFLILVFYYIPQEALFGRTVGKLLTKTKVVDLNGNKITFGKTILRTICRFIPFEAFSFLGGGGRPQGWHDSLSKTKVVTLKEKKTKKRTSV